MEFVELEWVWGLERKVAGNNDLRGCVRSTRGSNEPRELRRMDEALREWNRGEGSRCSSLVSCRRGRERR